jgi:hypothetical protein
LLVLRDPTIAYECGAAQKKVRISSDGTIAVPYGKARHSLRHQTVATDWTKIDDTV